MPMTRVTYAAEYRTARARIEYLEAELLNLTPGGSEYHGSPERCLQWARDRMAMTGKIAKERNELRAALSAKQREADELGECLKAAMDAIHRIAAAADVQVGGVLPVTVQQIVEKLEQARAMDKRMAERESEDPIEALEAQGYTVTYDHEGYW